MMKNKSPPYVTALLHESANRRGNWWAFHKQGASRISREEGLGKLSLQYQNPEIREEEDRFIIRHRTVVARNLYRDQHRLGRSRCQYKGRNYRNRRVTYGKDYLNNPS